jgi:hypothetical protein
MNTLQEILETIEEANLPEGTYLELCNKLKTLSNKLIPEPNESNNITPIPAPSPISTIINFIKKNNFFPNIQDILNDELPIEERYSRRLWWGFQDHINREYEVDIEDMFSWIRDNVNWDFNVGSFSEMYNDTTPQLNKLLWFMDNFKYLCNTYTHISTGSIGDYDNFIKSTRCHILLTDNAINNITNNKSYRTTLLKRLLFCKGYEYSLIRKHLKDDITNDTWGNIIPFHFTNETIIKHYKNKTTTTLIDKSKYYKVQIKILLQPECFENTYIPYWAEWTTYTKKSTLARDTVLPGCLQRILYHYFQIHTNLIPSYKFYYSAFQLQHGEPLKLKKRDGKERTYETDIYIKNSAFPSIITLKLS